MRALGHAQESEGGTMNSSRWYVAGACSHIRCGTPPSQTVVIFYQIFMGWGRARIYAAARPSHTTKCLTKGPQMQQQAHRLTHPAGHRTSKARQQPSQQAIWGASEQPASHPVSNQMPTISGRRAICFHIRCGTPRVIPPTLLTPDVPASSGPMRRTKLS